VLSSAQNGGGSGEGGITGSSGDEGREESVEGERLVLGDGPGRVLTSSDRGESYSLTLLLSKNQYAVGHLL
jgi:hypothetical protein